MTDIINTAPWYQRAELEQLRGNSRLFGHVADRLGMKFRVVHAMWLWPGRAVVDEVSAGTRADALQWLASRAYKACNRLLQQSMQQAWDDAFDHRPVAYWLPDPAVTPTITSRPSLSLEMDACPPF